MFSLALVLATTPAPAAPLWGRCPSPAAVGDLFPGATKNSEYIVSRVQRVEDISGKLVAWRYDSREGPWFLQPLPPLSAADAQYLHVTVPSVGVGAIYLRNNLPIGLRLEVCR